MVNAGLDSDYYGQDNSGDGPALGEGTAEMGSYKGMNRLISNFLQPPTQNRLRLENARIDVFNGSPNSGWDIVAAATAGVSYEITEDIIWDTSYRYLWQNGGLRLSTKEVQSVRVS